MSMLPVDIYKRLEPDLERCLFCGIVAEGVCDRAPIDTCEKALAAVRLDKFTGEKVQPGPNLKLIAARGELVKGIVEEYVQGYVLEHDSGHYQPSAAESLMLLDATMGLLSEPEFLRAVHAWCQAAAALAYKE